MQARNPDLQHLHVERGCRDERPEKTLPLVGERQHDERPEPRPGQRQHHAPEDRPLPRAFQPGGVFEVAWNREKELPQQEDPAHGYQLGRDQPLVAVHPAERADEEKPGHEEQHRRDHERREIDDKQAVASREPQSREGVGRGRTGEHLPQRNGAREYGAIQKKPAERRGRERGGERLRMRAAQPVALSQQRRGYHIKERCQHDERDRQADEVGEPRVPFPSPPSRSTHIRRAGRAASAAPGWRSAGLRTAAARARWHRRTGAAPRPCGRCDTPRHRCCRAGLPP